MEFENIFDTYDIEKDGFQVRMISKDGGVREYLVKQKSKEKSYPSQIIKTDETDTKTLEYQRAGKDRKITTVQLMKDLEKYTQYEILFASKNEDGPDEPILDEDGNKYEPTVDGEIITQIRDTEFDYIMEKPYDFMLMQKAYEGKEQVQMSLDTLQDMVKDLASDFGQKVRYIMDHMEKIVDLCILPQSKRKAKKTIKATNAKGATNG